MKDPDREFVYLLTDWQNRLFGYLVTLLGNVHDAHDVLQETNLVLWRKMDNFTPGTQFGAWARKCAYFQARAFLRDRKRDRHVFDDDLLGQLADEDVEVDDAYDSSDRMLAMRDCLTRLPAEHRQMITLRYGEGQSVRQLAEGTQKKESAIKMTLMRIRQSLHKCIGLKQKGVEW